MCSTRLGKRDEAKIRPIRVQFGNHWVREKIVKKSWRLKYSLIFTGARFPEGVSLARDLTKDERVIEKAKYLQKKRDDNTAGKNTENDTVPNVSETSQEDRPEAGTRDHTHPQTEEESEGT